MVPASVIVRYVVFKQDMRPCIVRWVWWTSHTWPFPDNMTSFTCNIVSVLLYEDGSEAISSSGPLYERRSLWFQSFPQLAVQFGSHWPFTNITNITLSSSSSQVSMRLPRPRLVIYLFKRYVNFGAFPHDHLTAFSYVFDRQSFLRAFKLLWLHLPKEAGLNRSLLLLMLDMPGGARFFDSE